MTLKNNRAPLLSIIKLYASFHYHMWIQTGVTVRKRLSWVMTSVTLTFDLWPWPFAWTSLLSLVITPENFMMIRWWEHSQKGVRDRQTDGRTDWTIHRAAKNCVIVHFVSITYRLNTRVNTKVIFASTHHLSSARLMLLIADFTIVARNGLLWPSIMTSPRFDLWRHVIKCNIWCL